MLLDDKIKFCGRTNLIKDVTQKIINNNSIALLGHKKSGKSILLNILYDIFEGEIKDYLIDIIDDRLKHYIMHDLRLSSQYTSIFLDAKNLDNRNHDSFFSKLYQLLKNRINLTPESNDLNIRDILEKISKDFKKEKRILILFIDHLDFFSKINSKEIQEILQKLISLLTDFTNIIWIFSWSDSWEFDKEAHEIFSQKLKLIYLSKLDNYEIKKLVNNLLDDYYESDKNILTQRIIDYTGGKPYFIKSICNYLNNNHVIKLIKNDKLDEILEIIDSADFVNSLESFYYLDRVNDLRSKLLALITRENIKINKLAKLLNESKLKLIPILDYFINIDKIRFENNKYYIAGQIINNWGLKNTKYPVLKFRFKKYFLLLLKLLSIPLLFISWYYVYNYTHPDYEKEQIKINDDIKIFLTYPKSIERNENGKIKLSIRNVKNDNLDTISIIVKSDDMEFNRNNTNTIIIESLYSNEEKFFEMDFNANPNIKNSLDSLNVNIGLFRKNIYKSTNFFIKHRKPPVKNYWYIISAIGSILGILGFRVNWIKSLFSFIGKLK